MKKNYPYQKRAEVPKTLGVIVLMLFVFMLGWNVGVNHVEQRDSKSSGNNIVVNPYGKVETVDMRLFWDAWSILGTYYVDPHMLDTQEMIYGAIRGMVSAAGDPYTTFLTPKENKDFQDNLDGMLEGIGAELTVRHNLLTVVSPLKNSPAKKAGLQPEDVIYKIDGEDAANLSLEQAVMKIRGKKGTQVTLTVLRQGHDEPIDLVITRNTINVNSVDWRMEGDIAILEVNQFGTNTKQEFSQTINEVLNERPKGIVLDLRYNGGGFLEGSIDVTSEFLEKEKVVTIKKRNPEEDEVIYTNGQARMANIPLVVLINRGSASASEIVAGALQDHKRAVVIGETSFGKGTVQTVQNLIGGASLRITIAKWFTPNDHNITEMGITPDIEVERTPDDFEENRDPQLDRALEELNKL